MIDAEGIVKALNKLNMADMSYCLSVIKAEDPEKTIKKFQDITDSLKIFGYINSDIMESEDAAYVTLRGLLFARDIKPIYEKYKAYIDLDNSANPFNFKIDL